MNDTHLADEELLERAQAFHSASRDHSSDWRAESREDYDFVAGEQWEDTDKQTLRDQLRPVVTFNRIGPVVDAVAGSEVSNRQEVRYIPRTQGDAGVNEVYTAAAKWVRDECGAEDEESDAFIDTVVCGMGWTETRMDYEYDPDGKICIDRVDPLEMYWSHTATKRNLSDAMELGRKRKIAKRDFDDMWPDHIDVPSDAAGVWGEADDDEKEPHFNDPKNEYSGENGDGGTSKDQVIVFEYQWCERRPVWRVANPQSGELETLTEEQYRKLQRGADKAQAEIRAVRQMQRRYYRAFFCGNVLLEAGPSPCKTGFTYRCITGKRDRNRNTWYGLVRAMKDPQRWANKFFSQILHIISTSGKGVMAEEGAFKNPRKANEDWSSPDAVVLLNNGAISGNKIQPKPGSQLPAGLADMMTFAISSIRDTAGVSQELLGMAERMQPGVLEYQRKQSGLTILATLFDSLRRYRKDQGQILLEYITEYLSDGRLIRVVGDEGAKYVPLTRDPNVVKYDVIVDEAPTSPNMKERTWQLLQPILPQLFNLGLPKEVYLELFKYSPLPESLMEKVQGMIANQPPQPNPEQQKAEMEMQIKQQTAAADMQLQQQKAEAAAAQKQREVEIEAQLAVIRQNSEIELMRVRAAAEIQLAREKAAAEAQLARERAAMEAEIARERAARQDALSANRPGGSLSE